MFYLLSRNLPIFICLFTSANVLAMSAERASGVSYKHYVSEAVGESERTILGSPISRSGPYDRLKLPKDLDFETHLDLERAFWHVRDTRFMGHKNRIRRSSWMYPKDGCWIRAELINFNLETESFPGLRKLFIFGDLKVETEFSDSGSVKWWYHVAPIARSPKGVFVIDPAINPKGPTPIEEWVLYQVDRIGDANLAICNSATFSPNDSCETPKRRSRGSVESSQKRYLDSEERLLRRLGYNVDAYLGDAPPWLNPMPTIY